MTGPGATCVQPQTATTPCKHLAARLHKELIALLATSSQRPRDTNPFIQQVVCALCHRARSGDFCALCSTNQTAAETWLDMTCAVMPLADIVASWFRTVDDANAMLAYLRPPGVDASMKRSLRAAACYKLLDELGRFARQSWWSRAVHSEQP